MRRLLAALVAALILTASCWLGWGPPAPAQAAQQLPEGFRLAHRLAIEGQVLNLHDGGGVYLVTYSDGRLVRDRRLADKAAYGTMIMRHWFSPLEMEEFSRYQKKIDDFLNLEAAAQAALFFRGAASQALVDVGVAYLTGDPSQFTGQATRRLVKEAAKTAVKDTLQSMAADPDGFLRAVAIKALKQARADLGELAAAGRYLSEGVIDYQRLERLDKLARRTYTTIVPAMDLMHALRPGADAASQLKDVAGDMLARLKDKVPGDFDALDEMRKQNFYLRLGDKLDQLYQHYTPYRKYIQARKLFQQKALRGDKARRALARDKVKFGYQLMAELAPEPPPQPEPEPEPQPKPKPKPKPKPEIRRLGVIRASQAPKTWTLNIPQDFSKLELAVYGKGKNETNSFGGWKAWLKVNGKYAWKFIGYDNKHGGKIKNYLSGRRVWEKSGKGRWLDVTKLVRPGRNKITYYHYTGGSGVGVKMRLSR
ncbi:MAG: hypothetical protein JRJ59_05555 [Deltaproteobacteria bacterium]|nr:hypothetical protein [Deltaproteobacteria bacterium]